MNQISAQVHLALIREASGEALETELQRAQAEASWSNEIKGA